MPTAQAQRSKRTAEKPPDPPVTPDPEAAQPVGRSSSKRERQLWEHDGKFYDLKALGDFGIGEQRRLNRDGREFYQLWSSPEDLTEDQEKLLKQLLERMFAKVIDAPRTVQRTFDDAAKADVVLHFTLAPLGGPAALAMAQMMMMQAAQQPQDGESTTTT